MSEVEINQVIDPEGRLVSRLDAKKRDTVDADADADIFDNEESPRPPLVKKKKQKAEKDDDPDYVDEEAKKDEEEEEEAGDKDAVKHALY